MKETLEHIMDTLAHKRYVLEACSNLIKYLYLFLLAKINIIDSIAAINSANTTESHIPSISQIKGNKNPSGINIIILPKKFIVK